MASQLVPTCFATGQIVNRGIKRYAAGEVSTDLGSSHDDNRRLNLDTNRNALYLLVSWRSTSKSAG